MRNIFRSKIVTIACVSASLLVIGNVPVHAQNGWLQWGRNAQHNGDSPVVGQTPQAQLADINFDPFVAQEQAEAKGPLTMHYQAPLVDGNTAFMEYKTGTYTSCSPAGSHSPYPCGPDAWNWEVWNERAFTWQNGALVEEWNFASDWKPEPNSNVNDIGARRQVGLQGWEPVFHAAISNGSVFVPGAWGSVYKLDENTGAVLGHFTPFGSDTNTYVSGPLTADASGNVFYNALKLDATMPWSSNVKGAWLVKIAADGTTRTVTYGTLAGTGGVCFGTSLCGSQRPGINVAPAISNDGTTVYTVSVAHLVASGGAYLIAANVSDLSPQWRTSMVGLVEADASNYPLDQSSATPSIAPDGSILFGTLRSNDRTSRGDLLKFNSNGQYLAYFHFGWDLTPAIYPHDGTYSVVLKNNFYDTFGPYFITQLNSDLVSEWTYKNKTYNSHHRNGYEWCVNAPAVDANGNVYANSEDGNIYVINQGGTMNSRIFLREAIEAAYTPIALGPDGLIYAENDGDLFVLGEQ